MEGVFRNLTRLNDLYMSNNQLTGLHPDVFANCTMLMVVDISNNRITSLAPQLFSARHTAMRTLNALNNRLSIFLPSWNLPALVELYMQNNNIANMSLHELSSSATLQVLGVGNNDLNSTGFLV